MRFRKRELEDPRPNITPLVDILFLLIIFFTVTTTFATTGGIDVNLPKASSRRDIEKVEKLFVVVNAEGRAFIEGEPMNAAELLAGFRDLAGRNPDALVIVEADERTDHGRVVEVMDTAQTAGLNRLAIATERKPPETPPGEGPDETEEDGGD